MVVKSVCCSDVYARSEHPSLHISSDNQHFTVICNVLAMYGDCIIIIYYIKLKSRLSVCLSFRLHLRIILVVSAWINLGLGLCIAEVFEMCMDAFPSF